MRLSVRPGPRSRRRLVKSRHPAAGEWLWLWHESQEQDQEGERSLAETTKEGEEQLREEDGGTWPGEFGEWGKLLAGCAA